MKLWNRKKGMADAKGAATRPEIESRLALLTEALRAADANLARLSLEAVTSGDDSEALAAQDHLRKLENQHGLLVAALVECARVEAEREAVFRAQQNVTARRAFNQHAGRFQRDASDVAKAIADLQDARARLEASAGSIVAVCPAHLRTPSFPIHELFSPHGLRGRIEVEQYRLDPQRQKPRPGFEYQDFRTNHIAPLTETLSALVAQVREQFDCAPPPTKPPLPVHPSSASSPPADSGDDAGPLPPSLPAGVDLAAPPDRAAPSEPLRGVAVSLRGGQAQITELTEPFARHELSESEAEALLVPTDGEAAPVAGMAAPSERSARAGIDFTPLFHGGA